MNATPYFNARTGLILCLYIALALAFCLVCQEALASEGTEFQAAAIKIEQWVKGNLGKLSALLCVAVGSVIAAIRKDWSWLIGGLILALGIGIIVGIINVSFTATL